jgi:hypothetical protein
MKKEGGSMPSTRHFRSRLTGCCSLILLALLPGMAVAQPVAPDLPDEPPAAGDEDPTPAEGSDGGEELDSDDGDGTEEATPESEPAAEPTAAEPTATEPTADTPETVRSSITSAGAGEEEATDEEAATSDEEAASESTTWYDLIDVSAFVDIYAAHNWAAPKPLGASTYLRAFDRSTGFALSWAGVDLSVPSEPVGAHLSLRLGPSAQTHGDSCLSAQPSVGPCDDAVGLSSVRQAYATWRPAERWSIDIGKFDTFVGAEVAESQGNPNYTRGLLFWLGQPLFHTGLRVEHSMTSWLTARALVANGYNNSVENNLGKTLGLQGEFRVAEPLTVKLSWLGGPEQNDTTTIDCPADTAYDPSFGGCGPTEAGTSAATYQVDRGGANLWYFWRHLADLVVDYQATDALRLVANVDWGTERVRVERYGGRTPSSSRASWYGAALSARYQLPANWALAGRGEYYSDPNGMTNVVPGAKLSSWTATVEYLPFDSMILRLEQRADLCHDANGSRRIFPEQVRGGTTRQVTTTLGVVVQMP